MKKGTALIAEERCRQIEKEIAIKKHDYGTLLTKLPGGKD